MLLFLIYYRIWNWYMLKLVYVRLLVLNGFPSHSDIIRIASPTILLKCERDRGTQSVCKSIQPNYRWRTIGTSIPHGISTHGRKMFIYL